MKLIEIIPAYFTAHATTERCRQLVTALGKRDVVCRATPGFIVNRMARPYYRKGSAYWKNTWRARRRSTVPSRPAGTFVWGRSS